MSRVNTINSEKNSFVSRLIEVCDSAQPAKVAQLLNISYQAAKNYLNGRLPDAKILKTIAEKTPYSINWLLTGEGEKFAKLPAAQDTVLLTDQMREFVRQVCLEVMTEILDGQSKQLQQKTVLLTSENIKQEKVLSQTAVFSETKGK